MRTRLRNGATTETQGGQEVSTTTETEGAV